MPSLCKSPVLGHRNATASDSWNVLYRRQIAHIDNPGALYSELMELIVRLARSGLIHGDFNEFNLLIREANAEKGEVNPVPILIDFPQMVSTEHENAEYYFNRDVECIRTFFRKRFRYESSVYPKFLSTVNENDGKKDFELDVMVAASGFGKKEGEALERYMKMIEEAEGDEEEEDEDAEGDEDEEEGKEVKQELDSNAHTILKQSGLDYASADESSEEVDKLGNRIRKSVNLEEGSVNVQNQAEQVDVGSSSNGEEQEEQEDEADSSEAEESEEDDASQKEGSMTRQQQQRRKAMERATRDTTAARKPRDVQAIVTSSLAKHERSKHHGKKSRTDAGRSKGSKKKADPRYKMENEF